MKLKFMTAICMLCRSEETATRGGFPSETFAIFGAAMNRTLLNRLGHLPNRNPVTYCNYKHLITDRGVVLKRPRDGNVRGTHRRANRGRVWGAQVRWTERGTVCTRATASINIYLLTCAVVPGVFNFVRGPRSCKNKLSLVSGTSRRYIFRYYYLN